MCSTRGGRIGFSIRDSSTANATSIAIEMPATASVRAESQPYSVVLMIA